MTGVLGTRVAGDRRAGAGSHPEETPRGRSLLVDPLRNKGTCFTRTEREALGLVGLLPPGTSSTHEQELRAYDNFRRAGDDVQRYLFLASLQDRNETLFYKLLVDHLEEMAPIVYTPTVGKVCEEYSHLYRRPRGIYISPLERGRIRDVLAAHARPQTRIVVVTDNEAILGLGDLGVGGMGIPIGKLALYTAAAGIHPGACLPLDFDVGTDNQTLLDDPLYLGVRHARLRGEAYYSLLDELVGALATVLPEAVVQWEDFANDNAFQILQRYRRRVPSFNDDIQGTGAVVAAGIQTAVDRAGRRLADERVLFFGAGASGGGCALAVRAVLSAAGVPEAELSRRVLLLDSKGLLVHGRPDLGGHKLELATDPAFVAGWTTGDRIGLLDAVRRFKPTVLIGCSGRAGAFTEDVVRAMHAGCPRPIIFPISNPNRMAEAQPADVVSWTDGQALIACGSPFPPVVHGDVTWKIGQGNNALVFPGVGLGAIAAEARWIPDAAFLASSRALHTLSRDEVRPGAALFPPMARLRGVARIVAQSVAEAIVAAGAAPERTPGQLAERIRGLIWEPVYGGA